MRFWKLFAHWWQFGSSNADRTRVVYRVATLEQDEFEEQTGRTALYYTPPAPNDGQIAELFQLSTHLREQTSTQSRFHQLSVVIVDYLLEYEWFWLLTGRRSPRPTHNTTRPDFDVARSITLADASPADGEPGRTLCAGDSHWSISSTIIPLPPPPPRPVDEAE